MRIAIIGMGVVGQAVAAASYKCKISSFDKYNQNRTQNWGDAQITELCFVCVPTLTVNRKQDLTEIFSTMKMLERMKYRGVVCIKSTVLPGTMDKLEEAFQDLRIVHSPEFLSEKTARQDYLLQKTALLSGQIEDTSIVMKYFDENLQVTKTFVYTDFNITEFAKYMHNCMLAVELSFLNEMYDLCGDKEVYNKAIEAAIPFGNIGKLSKVPGPDGKRGWGGMCFPKDMVALQDFSVQQKVSTDTLDGAISTNARHRPEEMAKQYYKETSK